MSHRVAVFSAKPYDEEFLSAAAGPDVALEFFATQLRPATVSLAEGCQAVCAFVNDDLGAETMQRLNTLGVTAIAMRCAGTNNVQLETARQLGMRVVRVPGYSPHAVAEHAMGLILALNRNIHRAHNRVREGNFALDGLIGFDLNGRTAGVVGTGQIGAAFVAICRGFGMEVLAFDPKRSQAVEAMGARYVELDTLFEQSEVISLHCPLLDATYHMVDADAVARMRAGVMLINTSRGALVDTEALIDGLKSGRIGHVGLDVYEEESSLFFEDRSSSVLTDDVFARLLTFPNVLITGHQAFLTTDALSAIANTTMSSLRALLVGDAPPDGVLVV